MTAFDFAVLAIIAISVLISILRGAMREIFGLLAWIVAVMVASSYAEDLAPVLETSISTEPLRVLTAFVVLFIATWLLMTLVAIAFSRLISSTVLSNANRTLGALFGFVRGIFIVLIVVMLAGLTKLPKQATWREAFLSGPFETAVIMLQPMLPEKFSKRIHYR